MNAVIKPDGQPCQCGFCRPDLNLVAVDQEIPVRTEPEPRQWTETQRRVREIAPVASKVPVLLN